ncbi:MAG: hypothetical protein A2798_03535 [Candidatus Levybacteria bacterium RIFCSPHIGHO2_01_FULL_37_17]|nr:MAG: hypothetical protein A2798_03535 [Candidatus Levybacteria bacterium RIFCSPHIGHO2_01_FULL_37_17]OGH36548.1 MAG: hypothetical protein A2959_03590 [Candidatus Levybacteria bacterium RIFCSPLOWO2_01_FULL_38_23]
MTQRQSQVIVSEGDSSSNESLLSIKRFAEVCRTTVRTVRFYDIRGLLKPFKVDEWTSYRYYKQEQAEDFLKIRFMHSFGVPLSQIRELLTINAQDTYLEERLVQIKKEIEEKQKQLRFLTNLRELLFEDKDLNKVFHKEKVGPFNLFCFKLENGTYDSVNKYRTQVREEAKRLGLSVEQRDIILYFDTDYRPKNARLEFSVICKKDHSKEGIEVKEGYYFRTMPKTKALVYDYQGLNAYFILVYQRLFDYIYDNRIQLKNSVFDINLEEPEAKLSPFDYRTKLIFPIK